MKKDAHNYPEIKDDERMKMDEQATMNENINKGGADDIRNDLACARESGVRPSLVVGIGASAGGLEALQQFLNCMSPVSNLAFVVVQHLSPDYKSLLAEILAKNTKMTVVQAENEMFVEANGVYLIPPKNNMIIQKGRLLLQEYVHTGINHPIDIFFNSLAEEMHEHSIAVVLSGTGTDGTNGIKTIKEEGGLVIIQDPSSAKFDGMPRSAINTGLADFILNPQGIAEEILNFSNYPTVSQEDDDFSLFSDEEVLSRIYAILKKSSKIDYSHYKKTTILRRIERRMMVTHQDKLTDYVELLSADSEEATILGKEILIGVTNFFRDPAYFEKLKQIVVMSIFATSNDKDPIRIWSAGCSTGEEAYSLAIIFAEAMEELSIKRDVKIFATDVDAGAVDFAGKGVYGESIMDDISPERLSKFFNRKGDQYVVSKDIRKMIIFAPHNVFQDPPFGRLDLISCRNVMIYFQQVLQKNLLSIFHTALKDGGYLFLGKSETAGEYGDVFKTVCSVEKIYRHDSDGRLPEVVPISYSTPQIYPAQVKINEEVYEEKNLYAMEGSYLQFLENYLPPCAVIDELNNIVHVFGDFGEYLHISRGHMAMNIFSLISDDLSLVVSNALNKARKEKIQVTFTDVCVTVNDKPSMIDLTVQPVFDRRGKETGLTVIVFSTNAQVDVDGFKEKYDIDKTAAQRIVDLERELLDSQESLKATIVELETVNEELQAANEELLTANEELQSSNEELQSVNEELYTVNAEYQQKLEELQDLNNDMSNFLSSTMIGIVFVDNAMNIRKFTEYVGREFGLMDHDVGRPLQILSHNFQSVDLATDAADVLKMLMPIEREVQATNDKHYTMRVAPYRTTDNSIKGLVITIIDSLSAATK